MTCSLLLMLHKVKSKVLSIYLYISVCVGVLSKVRHLIDNLILVILCYSLIYPFLTYGDHVWGLTFPSFLTQLCSIQKKAVNNIFFWTKIPFWAFVQISQLTWAQWCHLITGIHFCLSVVMRTVTSQFQWIFQIYLFVHSYSTRQSCKRNLYVASVNTIQYGICSLKFSGPQLWNSLPIGITNSNSYIWN